LLGPPPMKTTSSEKLENEGKILDDEAEVSGSDVSEDEQVEGSEAGIWLKGIKHLPYWLII
jgi:hypothetical protein